MPVNRRTRDQILIEALDLADLPELDQHDRPSATIASTAFSIQWLQRCLDVMSQEFPWASEVTSTTGSLTTLNQDLGLTDFILDVRGGFLIKDGGSTIPLIRRNFQDIMLYQTKNDAGGTPITGRPRLYNFTGTTVRLNVTPDKTYTFVLWYYAMPSVLAASTIPTFPSDHICIEYIFWRAMEWARKAAPGAAMKYLREVEMPAYRSAGLNQEPESDHIPLDELQFRGARRKMWDWSGWEVRNG